MSSQILYIQRGGQLYHKIQGNIIANRRIVEVLFILLMLYTKYVDK